MRAKTIGRVKALEDKLVPGRPRKEPPSDAAEIIRTVCAGGGSKQGCAMALACSTDVLARWLDEDPALADAMAQGRERERQTLHSVVYDAATKGTGKDALLAAFFILNSKFGYSSGQQESQANKVSITFNLPGALQPAAYVIENANGQTANLNLSKPNIGRA